MRRISTLVLVAGLFGTSSGCVFDEGLLIENLTGTVSVPVDAATRSFIDADGNLQTLTDVRLIGPVFLGLYPSIEEPNVIDRYPHPEVGPQYLEGIQGDAYPYGGTAVGDVRFACLEFLACKVTSGRFVDWDDMVDWFKLIQEPITDSAGRTIDDGEFLKQTCYDLLNVTSDAETRITVYEDRNLDGAMDALDLDFVLDDAGEYFVGEFTMWQQEMFYDQDQEDCTPGVDCKGMSLWGWMDAPSQSSFQYTTCDPSTGFDVEVYDAEFFGGQLETDLLNFPSQYISDGDWVSGTAFQWDDKDAEPNLVLDFEVL